MAVLHKCRPLIAKGTGIIPDSLSAPRAGNMPIADAVVAAMLLLLRSGVLLLLFRLTVVLLLLGESGDREQQRHGKQPH